MQHFTCMPTSEGKERGARKRGQAGIGTKKGSWMRNHLERLQLLGSKDLRYFNTVWFLVFWFKSWFKSQDHGAPLGHKIRFEMISVDAIPYLVILNIIVALIALHLSKMPTKSLLSQQNSTAVLYFKWCMFIIRFFFWWFLKILWLCLSVSKWFFNLLVAHH